MESRGDAMNASSGRRRLAIPRRSVSVASSLAFETGANQPYWISVTNVGLESERKIDEIAEGLEAVKVLLQKSHLPIRREHEDHSLLSIPASSTVGALSISELPITTPQQEPVKWDHSAQVNEFVRTVTEDRASREDQGVEESDILASLRRLARALEDSNVLRDLSFPETRGAQPQDHVSMPPTEAAVRVLRWSKDHKAFFRIEAVSRILPLEKFTEAMSAERPSGSLTATTHTPNEHGSCSGAYIRGILCCRKLQSHTRVDIYLKRSKSLPDSRAASRSRLRTRRRLTGGSSKPLLDGVPPRKEPIPTPRPILQLPRYRGHNALTKRPKYQALLPGLEDPREDIRTALQPGWISRIEYRARRDGTGVGFGTARDH
ncbi:hypothetical protein O1611_g10029 [Lasiodiplodia mahajangana]|uniref:Uncharacterized protein n=1 Tax=Lasiodiplodia mahajangana TaxID=1108764 RepID=A0ACC2J2K2_9PEZI|nr:hypothetical protein O1611_g10029 [Lasiodiplodia mahajangana]